MLTQLREAIEQLKTRVQGNLNIIHKNEKVVRKILEEPVSNSRSQKLEVKYEENKKLLKENNDSIKLQLQLTKFIDTYKNELQETEEPQMEEQQTIQKTEEPLTKEDIYHLTINKELEFDEQHPFYNDEEFFNDIMEHFTSVEDYEMCSYLMENRKKLHDS